MFIRMKPICFGNKIWVLAGADGYPYALNIYTGKSSNETTPLGFRVVDGLLQNVKEVSDPRFHMIYFDNFFTSYQLLAHPREDGFRATGTVRQNRTKGASKLMVSDKDMKKRERGSYDYRCDGSVFVVKWNDSSIVSLASNVQGHQPEQTANRWVGREVKHVKQPMLINRYNKGMGGVDLFDEMLTTYRPTVRGKKWWWPLFTHVLNATVVASWRIYRATNPASNLSHLEFRRNIVLCLSKVAHFKPTPGGAHAHYPPDVRHDGVGHLNESTSEGRCVVCRRNTCNKCTKCGVRLHYARGAQCFVKYHTLP